LVKYDLTNHAISKLAPWPAGRTRPSYSRAFSLSHQTQDRD
jgi:hypothetical protein